MLELLNKISSSISIDKNGNLIYKDTSIIVPFEELKNKVTAKAKIMNFIYHYFYSKQDSTSFMNTNEIQLINDLSFEIELSKIQSHRKIKSTNWIIKNIINDHTFQVKKNNITLTIDTEKHLLENERTTPHQIEEELTILFSCHFPNVSNGFYVYKSQEELSSDKPIGRLYFNLIPKNSLKFVNLLLKTAYDNLLTFDFKIFKNIRNQYRTDNAVLYFKLSDFNKIEKVLFPAILKQEFFNNEVSEFHFMIFSGVGYAEEPKSTMSLESYGTNRCHIIAENIYDIIESNNFSNKELIFPLQLFINKFEQYNIDLNQIYKNRDSNFQPKKYKV